MSKRYVIKQGKFGMYFHDTKESKDLSLVQVQALLNGEELSDYPHIYYMRDNHTFLRLPHDIGEAISTLEEDVAKNNMEYGMLAARDEFDKNVGKSLHANGDMEEFYGRLRAWYKANL